MGMKIDTRHKQKRKGYEVEGKKGKNENIGFMVVIHSPLRYNLGLYACDFYILFCNKLLYLRMFYSFIF